MKETLQRWFSSASSADANFRFASPIMLLLLFAIPAFLLILAWRRRRMPTLRFASTALLRSAGGSDGRRWRRFVEFLRVLVLVLGILALARPQYGRVDRQTYSEGIDIALVLDVSLSMRQNDLHPNRLEAAKYVLDGFVEGRIGDRIGLVIFGAEAAGIVPMTLDYTVVRSFISRINFSLVNGDATAIGMGLATALKKLSVSQAKTKVVILLTDGENNAGKIDPLTAAEAARASKVKVYTIGVGRETDPSRTPGGMVRGDGGLDEELLTQIAEMTGGRYFRATDNETLAGVYHEIDRLEKSKVESTQFDNFNDLAPLLLIPGILILIAEAGIRSWRFVRIPA